MGRSLPSCKTLKMGNMKSWNLSTVSCNSLVMQARSSRGLRVQAPPKLLSISEAEKTRSPIILDTSDRSNPVTAASSA